ncbi:GntR family transcriptional regulator [Mesorhizobium tianshanense]|uniref:DNA-binding transcriptional MocR family regulator n=1 Tax=Mesorhizobium tianshanense TaxID=39844 RepID=A0A562MZN8_9HYPH|nr:PLP-dependent aminotransferase family protein [Mesorhizobium tianshanense]TWI25385.1 DNA-binding transcriptional MocR family regulator [Mesorhizobium tianshanense]GLS38505.1 GntR family transcriptional regulator [Mesorhizobium tianshanense]
MQDQEPVEILYLQVAESLATPIRAGTLVRGERIPSVRELARSRDVSVGTVLQAYRILEDAHLIEARPRSGYFVAARPPRLPEPETSNPPADSMAVDVSSLAARVMHLAHDPGYASFGAACPGAELFTEERVRRAVSRAVQHHRATLCQYTTGYGDESLRRAIARHALRMGCQIDPRDVVVTNSCLESITLCLRAVTRPGDIIALESPTLFAFLEILENLHLRALEIPTHPRTGFSLDALQLAFDTQPIKAVLAVPTLSNPIGSSIPLADRRRLAQMVAERGIPLIEDVLYNDFAEHEDQRQAVRSFDTTGHVMICGSFSKTIAPGLRLGWVDAGRWGAKLVRMKESTSGSQTTIIERALADLLAQPGIEAGYRQIRATIAARVDEARGLIARHFPGGTRVTDPRGGFILWLELPHGIDSLDLFQACLAESIVIAPGKMFSATNHFRHCIRLGLGGRWDDAHRHALRRVGELAETMALSRVARG